MVVVVVVVEEETAAEEAVLPREPPAHTTANKFSCLIPADLVCNRRLAIRAELR